MKSKLDAVIQLEQYDHCFLSPDGVRMIGEPFGYFGNHPAMVSSKEFKGLTVEGKQDGEMVDGMDAAELAEELCKLEGVEYPPMYGRGSRLRVCCAALSKKLK